MVLQVLVVFFRWPWCFRWPFRWPSFFKFLNCKEESNDEDDVNYTTKDLKKLDSVL